MAEPTLKDVLRAIAELRTETKADIAQVRYAPARPALPRTRVVLRPADPQRWTARTPALGIRRGAGPAAPRAARAGDGRLVATVVTLGVRVRASP
jgi:hypothetical protein